MPEHRDGILGRPSRWSSRPSSCRLAATLIGRWIASKPSALARKDSSASAYRPRPVSARPTVRSARCWI